MYDPPSSLPPPLPSAPTQLPPPIASSAHFELEKAKFQLAELIDEVVFAEASKSECDKELLRVKAQLENTESCLQNLLAYATALESSVIVPSLLDLTRAIPEETLTQRAKAMAQLDATNNVSSRTAKLILSLKSPPATVVQRFQARREEILRAQHWDQQPTVSLEEAYVLLAMFLDVKHELKILLDDTIERVAGSRSSTSSAVSASRQELSSLREENQNLTSEISKLKDTIAAVQSDREVLMAKLQQAAPLRELQEQFHSERDSLRTKLRRVEVELQQEREESAQVKGTLEATKAALEQTFQEKNVIERELGQYRAGKIRLNQSSADTSGFQYPQKYWEEQAHKLRLELDEFSRQHSTIVTALENKISMLRMEAAEGTRGVNAYSSTAGSQLQRHQADQIEQLRKANDDMQQELQQLQQQFLSSNVGVAPPSTHSSSLVGSPSPGYAFDGKIYAFEQTIRVLQSELAAVESKVASVEKHYREEREKLTESFNDERRRYQAEREECDALVLRMGGEMEQLVRENDELRQLSVRMNRSR